jgi:hypothetical protein
MAQEQLTPRPAPTRAAASMRWSNGVASADVGRTWRDRGRTTPRRWRRSGREVAGSRCGYQPRVRGIALEAEHAEVPVGVPASRRREPAQAETGRDADRRLDASARMRPRDAAHERPQAEVSHADRCVPTSPRMGNDWSRSTLPTVRPRHAKRRPTLGVASSTSRLPEAPRWRTPASR